MTHAERLEELYKIAVGQEDTCMALEIADRMRALPAAVVGVDERITVFIEAMDKMISQRESQQAHLAYRFEYGGHSFEVDFQ